MHKNKVRKSPDGKNIRIPNEHYVPYHGQTPYWWFVELGTKHSMAVPFLRPALTKNIDRVEDSFSKKFISEVEKVLP